MSFVIELGPQTLLQTRMCVHRPRVREIYSRTTSHNRATLHLQTAAQAWTSALLFVLLLQSEEPRWVGSLNLIDVLVPTDDDSGQHSSPIRRC